MSDGEFPTEFQILHGRLQPPTASTTLRAGPIEASLGPEGDLRRLRVGDLELVRRVFVTVRDRDWLEIPPRLSDLSVDADDSGFRVRFSARHASLGLSFAWNALVEGNPSGSITYLMDGLAEQSFTFCRIGFCVLHPPGCAGRRYHARTPDGDVEGTLPERIGVQDFDGEVFRGLFEAFDELTIYQAPETEIRFAFEGDLFEMEDQRNWTDGSFKTYSTPGYLGYPFSSSKGQRFRQQMTITPTVRSARPAVRPRSDRLTVALGEQLEVALPQLGVSLSGHEFSPRAVELLRPLKLDHVKFTLELSDSSVSDRLTHAARQARTLGCALELAAFVTDEPDGGFHRAAAALAELDAPVARVLVFREGEETTSAERMKIARDALGPRLPGVPLCGGTNLYFTELNRTRPDLASVDGVSWTINPQIHASDEASLVETLEIQGETVRSARAFCGDRPLIVSSVTLKPPFNADAMEKTAGEASPRPGELPSNVDPRQMSLFGAAWTLGSFKYLAENGVSSVTYYETSGWRGLFETFEGSDTAAGFPSFPRMVFPLYHVFADIADWRGSTLVSTESSRPAPGACHRIEATFESQHLDGESRTSRPPGRRAGTAAG